MSNDRWRGGTVPRPIEQATSSQAKIVLNDDYWTRTFSQAAARLTLLTCDPCTTHSLHCTRRRHSCIHSRMHGLFFFARPVRNVRHTPQKNKKLSHAPDAFPNLKQQLEEGQTEMQEPYEDYLDVECEDESTENVPAPIVCKSCGGGMWRSGRKDAAQLARRNEILNEVRELFDSGRTEQEVREHFGAERNTYVDIARYVTLFFRKHARKKNA